MALKPNLISNLMFIAAAGNLGLALVSYTQGGPFVLGTGAGVMFLIGGVLWRHHS